MYDQHTETATNKIKQKIENRKEKIEKRIYPGKTKYVIKNIQIETMIY